MVTEKIYKIDATDQSLGRLASQVATLLMGKNNPNYKPNQDLTVRVEIGNADKLKFSGNKMNQKIYRHYSGYPGGMKEILLKDLWQKYPERVLRQAVAGMLPANRLKKLRLKRLSILNNK